MAKIITTQDLEAILKAVNLTLVNPNAFEERDKAIYRVLGGIYDRGYDQGYADSQEDGQ